MVNAPKHDAYRVNLWDVTGDDRAVAPQGPFLVVPQEIGERRALRGDAECRAPARSPLRTSHGAHLGRIVEYFSTERLSHGGGKCKGCPCTIHFARFTNHRKKAAPDGAAFSLRHKKIGRFRGQPTGDGNGNMICGILWIHRDELLGEGLSCWCIPF